MGRRFWRGCLTEIISGLEAGDAEDVEDSQLYNARKSLAALVKKYGEEELRAIAYPG